MARLAAVPDTPPRALGLIRVSKERDEMISPDLQRTAIDEHAERRGYRVINYVEGLDESGSQRNSPWWRRLDEAIEMVERGEIDVIVVWKFSRTARNRLRWAVALDRVEAAGGRLDSATENIDASTSTGRFTRGMLAELAAFEADRIGDVWREVHDRRTRAGLPANGKPRFGYRVVDGLFEPDPETGPVLAAAYRRYVGGESLYSLVGWINGTGHLTVPGYSKRGPGPWDQTVLRRVLDSGFGAGLIKARGQLLPGAHAPVIDADLWAAYLAARTARARHRRTERSNYLLSGLLRCTYPVDGESCGSGMGGGGGTERTGPYYRCVAAANQRRHQHGYTKVAVVERAVVDWLREIADEVTESADQELSREVFVSRRRTDAQSLAREIAGVDRSLANLTVDLAQRLVPPDAYTAARDQLTAQRDALRLRLAQAEADAAESEHPSALAANLLADWDLLDVQLRRGMLRRLIDRIEVCSGRPAKVEVVPRFAR